jgi:hypothetical protein
MSLTNSTNVKQYIGISGSGDDTLLAALILYADDMVKRFLGRSLESTSYTERLDGNGRDFIRLANYPVISVTSVNVDAGWDFDPDNDEDAEDYYLDAEPGLIFHTTGVWSEGRRNIKVVYSAGYATLPKDVVHAANIIVADLYTRAKQLAGGGIQNELAQEDLGDRNDYYQKELTAGGIPAQAEAILNRYRVSS